MTVYFETSWAVLSTIGIVNTLLGALLIGITSLSPITAIPVIVSTSGAVANGLCYYAWYAEERIVHKVAAYATADVFWLIQEAFLSFYSFFILKHILAQREKQLFILVFSLLMMCVAAARIGIMVFRARAVLEQSETFTHATNVCHMVYFVFLALVETWSGFFLIRKFRDARRTSEAATAQPSVFKHLLLSTEGRLVTLAFIGIGRVITYSFNPVIVGSSQSSSQVDVLFYTLECLFPTLLFMDILASKIASLQRSQYAILSDIVSEHLPPPDQHRSLHRRAASRSLHGKVKLRSLPSHSVEIFHAEYKPDPPNISVPMSPKESFSTGGHGIIKAVNVTVENQCNGGQPR